MGELKCGAIVEGFDLRELSYTEDFAEEAKNIQDIVLVRRIRNKELGGKKKRAFRLKKLEEEGVMIEEAEE